MLLQKTIYTAVFALLLGFSAPTLAADQWHFNDVERVVAFSDVHGDFEAMVATLQSANVIDADLRWSGGGTHFVLVGDILDRGPGSRAAMDLLMQMETEAAGAGGMVHVLMGNHEVMNLIGDVRYVHPGEYASFADDESAAQRDKWFMAYRELRELPGEDIDKSQEQFDRSYPAGFFCASCCVRSGRQIRQLAAKQTNDRCRQWHSIRARWLVTQGCGDRAERGQRRPSWGRGPLCTSSTGTA